MPGINSKLKELAKNAMNPAWLCFVWFGMTAGISLLEAPVKFLAPTLTRPIALDVGRVVFQALNKAELVALIMLLILVRLSGKARELWALSALIVVIMITQSAWLLPLLSSRAELIVSGVEPPPSIAHAAYATTELTKLLLLLMLGFRSMRIFSRQAGHEL
jgi:hypothetical protein